MTKYTLPPLPYPYDALEPYIDARTMEIHHTKHHQAYIDKLNSALEKHPELFKKSLEELLKNINTVPHDIRQAVINHGGGHYNHSLFWNIMAPKRESEPKKGKLYLAIESKWGSLDSFKKEFNNSAISLFGSGWVWLIAKQDASLDICTTPNQNSIIMEGLIPIIGLDVWEHAYYLKYQNRRQDYVEAWWNVVSWDEVEKRYSKLG